MGGDGNDSVVGGAGNDTLTGGAGDDTVVGGAGDDNLVAGTGEGNDSYDGGANDDALTYPSTSLGITVDLPAGTVTSPEIDNDTFANIETIVGGAGDDIFIGNGGGLLLDGADGSDTVDFSTGTENLTVDLGAGSVAGFIGANDTLTNFENVVGGSGDDVLIGSASAFEALQSFELNASLGDLLGGDAITSGGGTLGSDGYTLDTDGQGLSLSNPGVTDTYSIEMRFSIDDIASFQKLIDFKDLGPDQGLYNLDGALSFFDTVDGTGTPFNTSEIAHLLITRDGATDAFVGYVNGVEEIAFTDSGELAVISDNILHFLIDDLDTSPDEQTTGFVDFIRIYDSPLDSSAALALSQGVDNILDGGAGNDSLSGLGGDDTLSGDDGADHLLGGFGNDVLDGGAGVDVQEGGSGDDRLVFDVADTTIIGGTGDDTLVADSATSTLDETALANVSGVENVDLNDNGGHTLILTASVVDDLSDTGTLTVTGDAVDAVQTDDAWFDDGQVDIDEVTFNQFSQGGNVLLVEDGVDDSGIQRVGANESILSDLDGNNGFRITGEAAGDTLGASVSLAGDVNGDGFEDIIVGAKSNSAGGNEAGAAYVVFGAAGGFSASVDASSLAAGVGGFRITGEFSGDYAGAAVGAAGDVNGDGIDDFIVGATNAGANGYNGAAFVVFGTNGNPGGVDLGNLDGTNGFRLTGENGDDYAGFSVSSAGDFNGDGIGDLLIGAPGYDVGTYNEAGAAYVVFGTDEGFASSIDLSQISNDVGGFALFGDDANNVAGNSVAAIGDINGDGLDDILVGAPDNGLNNYNYGYNGQSYVIFGTTGVTASSGLGNITAGTGGFLIAPENTYQGMGFAVAGAGDVNGDGIADLIVTAPADSDYSGAAYVVFGADGLSSSQINLSSVASGVGGFKISGSGTGDFSGMSVAAGDVNGDGIDDLLIGGVNFYGVESYYGGTGFVDVVFGGDGGFGSIDLYDIANGVGGFRIFGETTYDFAGRSVSSTDLNGDGFDDIVIGAAYYGATGAAYVVFGDDFSGVVTHLGTEFGDSLTGTENDDVIIGGAGNDFIIGNIGADVLKGGAGDDTIQYATNGFAKIDGGLGNDTFALQTIGGTLDLAQIGDEAITGIEVIDLSEQSNTLILDAFEVAALSDTGTLTVRGDGTDIVVTNDIWATDGTVTDGGDVFEVFTNSGKTLLVQDGIDVSGLQTEGIPILSLGDIDGVNGFRIVGEDAGDRAGFSVSTAGDFNGDGFEDVIVGAPYSDAAAGAAYVVFGTDSGVSDISLDNVASGTSGFGFRIVGEAANDTFGISVSAAGDVNGDGFDDLIIGAKANDTDSNEGAAYVVFGTGASVTAIDLVDIAAGTGGYKILGEYISDFAGSAVSGAGDINGDGIDDILVGAQRFPQGQAGAVYVVFGSTAAGSGVNLDDVALGTGGFRIDGENANDILGIRSGGVAAVGDVNGDGVDDFVIGAEGNDAGGNRAGAAYVVFGDSAGLTSVDLADVANGTGGFKITGENAGDSAGYDVSGAGDVNGDGIADLIVGAPFATNSETEAGAAYIVFGGAGLGASIDLGAIASGNGGFKITGSGAYDYAGGAVAAGDVNGDGFDDLIVGGDGYNGGYVDVVFGAASGLTTVDLADIADGQGGFRIAGEVATDSTGSSVSSADVNGDGFADIIIGSDTHPTGGTNAGAGFVVFGSDLSEVVTLQGTAAGDVLTGSSGDDIIIAGTGNDTLIGDAGADVLIGGAGDDVIDVDDTEFQRIVGGTGEDMLVVSGGAVDLDLGAIGDETIKGIDVITMTGGGDQITLSASDVRAMTDSGTLRLEGSFDVNTTDI